MVQKFTILDGGMGRELQRMGAPFQQPEWSAQALIEDPSWVVRAHQNFIDAGAQIITVNSYACVPFHLGDILFQEQGAQLIHLAAKIARDVVSKNTDKDCLVAGCLPPVFGSYRPDLFDSAHAQEILQVLIENQLEYVDFWQLETTSSIEEMQATLQALNDFDPKGLERRVSFTLIDDPDQEPCLRSGESVKSIMETISTSHVSSILFNCSVPEVMENAIQVVKQALRNKEGHKKIKIGVYPNAFTPIGEKHIANGNLQQLREITPQDYQNLAKKWLEAGASIIGGCCGITPSHIATLTQLQGCDDGKKC